MKKSTAVLFNFLYPGAGQFLLRRWIRGIIFSGIGTVSVVKLGWAIVELFVAIYRDLENNFELVATQRIHFLKTIAVSLLILIAIWIISFIDIAVFSAPRKSGGGK